MTLGFFIVFALVQSGDATGAALGIEGALVQMISHGFISGALFLCVGVMYDRLHSRMIGDYGGVAHRMPAFAAFMMLFALANSGLPGTSGFVGEFMVILASFKAGAWIAALAATTLVLGAAYTLWMYKRVVYGPVANEGVGGAGGRRPAGVRGAGGAGADGAAVRGMAGAAAGGDGAERGASGRASVEVEAVSGDRRFREDVR